MIQISEFSEILDELACALPEELYQRLNGGVNLQAGAKRHPESIGNDLYVLGEYCNTKDLGRFINIYYGSFCRIYPYLSAEELREKISEVLRHEFLHHLESLAGEKELELKDAEFLARYKAGL